MKKVAIFCLVFVIICSLVGCSERKETSVSRDKIEVSMEATNEVKEEIKEETKEDKTDKTEDTVNNKLVYVNYADLEDVFSLGCLNIDTMMLSSAKHLPVFKAETKEELDMFYNNYKDIFTFNIGYDEVPSFDEVIQNYTTEFFNKNMIIFAYIESSSGSYRYELLNIGKTDGVLCLNIVQSNFPESYTEDMAGWFVIYEVEKEELKNISNYDAIFVYTNINEEIDENLGILPGMIEFGDYSFEDYKKNLDMNSDKVRTEGFVNIEGREIESEDLSPIERAKLDTSKAYDYADYYYDGVADVWMVRFWNSDSIDNKEIVFLDGNGFTFLVVNE